MTPPEIDPELAERRRIEQAVSTDSLRTGGLALYFLAFLIFLAAVIAGGAMTVHQVCGVNPYDTSLSDCGIGGADHPLRNAGIGIIAAGVVQALLVCVLARVCIVVGTMRATVTPAAAPVVRGRHNGENPPPNPLWGPGAGDTRSSAE